MAVFQLTKDDNNQCMCPKCKGKLRMVDGKAVQIVNGRADMSSILPKYECDHCGIYFQELLGSGFYSEYDLPQKKTAKKMVKTGDLQPMVLKRDRNNQCVCPRCGEMMDFVEGQAVRLVEGVQTLQFDLSPAGCYGLFPVVGKIIGD